MKDLSKGFTLLEIVMVVTVIAILSVVTIPQFIDFSDDVKIAITKEKLVTIKRAITGDSRHVSSGKYLSLGFESNLGSLPTNLDDLVTQGGYPSYDPFTKKGWRGPYLSNASADWNQDAWKNAIAYDSGARTLTSSGPDETSPSGDDIVISF